MREVVLHSKEKEKKKEEEETRRRKKKKEKKRKDKKRKRRKVLDEGDTCSPHAEEDALAKETEKFQGAEEKDGGGELWEDSSGQ